MTWTCEVPSCGATIPQNEGRFVYADKLPAGTPGVNGIAVICTECYLRFRK